MTVCLLSVDSGGHVRGQGHGRTSALRDERGFNARKRVSESVLVNDGMPFGAIFTSRVFILYLFILPYVGSFIFPYTDWCWMIVLESVKAAAEDAEQGKREETYGGGRMSGKERGIDRQTDRPPDRHLISSCGRIAPSFRRV